MPTVPPYPPRGHPPWCDLGHAPTWPIHGRDIGKAQFPNLKLSATLVKHDDNPDTLLRVTFTVRQMPWIVDLAPEPAEVLRSMLAEGLRIQRGTR